LTKQVEAHARRHAEHGGEPERHAAEAAHEILGRALVAAVERDRPQRRLLGAELAGLADAVAAVGVRQDDALVLARELDQHPDGVAVGRGRADRIAVAQRRADQGGQRNDDVGLRDQLLHRLLVARVAAHEVEVLQMADVVERGLPEQEVVEHGHLVAGLEQLGHQGRADVAGTAGDQDRKRVGHAWSPNYTRG